MTSSRLGHEGRRNTTDLSRDDHPQHIPYHSHHDLRTTIGVLRSMKNRARNIRHSTKRCSRKYTIKIGFSMRLGSHSGEEDPSNPPITSLRTFTISTTGGCTHDPMHLSHQGATEVQNICVLQGVKPVVIPPMKILKRELMH